MMFSQKVFKRINTIAIFAIVFASLAPSISHALASTQGFNHFEQQICSANGQKITIQVVTAKGNQIETELEGNQTPSSSSNISHINHCPFCNNPSVHTGLEPPHTFVFSKRQDKAQQLKEALTTIIQIFKALSPPAQAPPSL